MQLVAGQQLELGLVSTSEDTIGVDYSVTSGQATLHTEVIELDWRSATKPAQAQAALARVRSRVRTVAQQALTNAGLAPGHRGRMQKAANNGLLPMDAESRSFFAGHLRGPQGTGETLGEATVEEDGSRRTIRVRRPRRGRRMLVRLVLVADTNCEVTVNGLGSTETV